jgi:hypothetical protein
MNARIAMTVGASVLSLHMVCAVLARAAEGLWVASNGEAEYHDEVDIGRNAITKRASSRWSRGRTAGLDGIQHWSWRVRAGSGEFERRSAGISIIVSAKGPRKFVPNCLSKPSSVTPRFSSRITPALFMSRIHLRFAADLLRKRPHRLQAREVQQFEPHSRLGKRLLDALYSIPAFRLRSRCQDSLRAATARDTSTGASYAPENMFHLKGDPVAVPLPKPALDEKAAQRLWTTAEDLTGTKWLI